MFVVAVAFTYFPREKELVEDEGEEGGRERRKQRNKAGYTDELSRAVGQEQSCKLNNFSA